MTRADGADAHDGTAHAPGRVRGRGAIREKRRFPQAAGALAVLAAATLAGAARADDGDICADRPTKADGACTLEPGVFQVETDIADGAFRRSHGVTDDTWLIVDPFLIYGLAPGIDVEAHLQPLVLDRTHDRSGTDVRTGLGDLELRAKVAVVGDGDKARFSATLIPRVTAPTARSGLGDGGWGGGAALVASYKLDDRWTVTVEPQLDGRPNEEGGGAHLVHTELVSLTRALPHGVTAAAELWSQWEDEPAGHVHQASLDLAAAWILHKTLQLDAGVNIGLNRQTPGAEVYAGVSKRF